MSDFRVGCRQNNESCTGVQITRINRVLADEYLGWRFVYVNNFSLFAATNTYAEVQVLNTLISTIVSPAT